MQTVRLEEIKIIGISVRTTNKNHQAMADIPALWNTFFSNNVLEKIPNKINNELYCIYTDYESDHTGPYTTILGCKVSSFECEPPEGMVSTIIAPTIPSETAAFRVFPVYGKLTDGIVYAEWQKIWSLAPKDLPRAYSADFELYTEEALKSTGDAHVDIYISIM